MSINRRNFIKLLGGATLLTVVPRRVLGGPNHVAPSDQLTKGIIGVGGIGKSKYHFTSDERCRLVAVCDVDRRHLRSAVELGHKKFNETLQAYEDYRDLIADPNVDIVHIATPPHWHGIMAVEAARAGKDIWCEKFYWVGKENLRPQSVPAELNYDMWLGPAPYKPYNEHRVHQTFRGYWDYDGGGLTDMGQHYMDPVQYLLGKDRTSPVKVEVDAPEQHPDAVGIWRKIVYTYDDGCQIVLEGEGFESKDDTPYIEGPLGKVYKGFRCTIPDVMEKLAELPDPEPQNTDFLECVRTRRRFALDEEIGHRSCTLVNMGACALRLNRTLHFDPVSQLFVGDDAANRLVDQPMRRPWQI